MKSIRIIVSGKVQGVGYRMFVRKHALSLEISGFAQNKPDQTVLIEACGQPEDLDDLVKFCQKGPRFAKVENVKVSDSTHVYQLDDFLIF